MAGMPEDEFLRRIRATATPPAAKAAHG
jgi:hypothetical protein